MRPAWWQFSGASRYTGANPYRSTTITGWRYYRADRRSAVSLPINTVGQAVSLLSANNLTLIAGDKILVSGLTIEFAAGQSWAVLGPNGSGKSTLLNIIGLLDEPSAGKITIGDKPIQNLSETS